MDNMNAAEARDGLQEMIENSTREDLERYARTSKNPDVLACVARNDPYGELNDIFFGRHDIDIGLTEYENLRLELARHCTLDKMAELSKCLGTPEHMEAMKGVFRQRSPELMRQVMGEDIGKAAVKYMFLLSSGDFYDLCKYNAEIGTPEKKINSAIALFENINPGTTAEMWVADFEDPEPNLKLGQMIDDKLTGSKEPRQEEVPDRDSKEKVHWEAHEYEMEEEYEKDNSVEDMIDRYWQLEDEEMWRREDEEMRRRESEMEYDDLDPDW